MAHYNGYENSPPIYIYPYLEASVGKLKPVFPFVQVRMSGGSSSGRGKGKQKVDPSPWEVDPNAWDRPLAPKVFSEFVDRFVVETKRDFSRDNPLQNYARRREPWPKCMHGEDCFVQMCTEGAEGGRRFFRYP
jgi:hypothetical protein